MSGDPQLQLPRWAAELYLALAGNSQFVLTGNVRDYHVVPGESDRPDTIDTDRALRIALGKRGIRTVFKYTPVDGLALAFQPEDGDALRVLFNRLSNGDRKSLEPLLGTSAETVAPELSKKLLGELMQLVVESAVPARAQGPAVALVLDYASWLMPEAERGIHGGDAATEAADALRWAHTLGATARPWMCGRRVPLYNPIIWIVRQQNDLPAWLLATPGLRIVSIEQPGSDTRRDYGRIALKQWDKYQELAHSGLAAEARQEVAVNQFADVTEGFTLRQGRDIINVAKDRQLELDQLPAAQFAYRVGVVESEWERPSLRAKVRGQKAGDLLSKDVMGQDRAVAKASEIVQRAVLGLAGAEASETNPRRPKGVLFLAGPTGTGKTLLAKSIAELIFRSKDNFARFDMSEYSQEHSDARLIGAPPGYVGYSAGGQLTEAVRQRPFTLLLFDEIEKAHPLILDKFLQVLDEGRLTDGSGMTVNFSETVIVFTSNLGIVQLARDERGHMEAKENITYAQRFPAGHGKGLSFADMESRVRGSVRDYFFSELRRPELLNRIGLSNIVVFDFIDRTTAGDILERAVAQVQATVQRKMGSTLVLGGAVPEQFANAVLTDQTLAMGGRGINAAVEEYLVNPLSRYLASQLDEYGRLSHRVLRVVNCSEDPLTQRPSLTFSAS